MKNIIPKLVTVIPAILWSLNDVYFKIIVENAPIRWNYFLGISVIKFDLYYFGMKKKQIVKTF